MRSAYIKRETKETHIEMTLTLDGGEGMPAGETDGAAGSPFSGIANNTGSRAPSGIVKDSGSRTLSGIDTGCGFLNHMLELFAAHSRFGLTVAARGDTDVDYHHLTEDIGIVLGQCFKQALGDGRGITRYASCHLPMDETLVLVALDISGRAYLNYDVDIRAQKVGYFDTELAREFLLALSRTLGLTLHVKLFCGDNAHHIIEAIFKGLGRALRAATAIDPALAGGIPSSKGALFI